MDQLQVSITVDQCSTRRETRRECFNLKYVPSSVWKSVSQLCTSGSRSSWIQCWPSQRIRSHWRKAKHLSFSHLYFVAETSTLLDHPRTPPRPRQGLLFEISDAMKKSKASRLLRSYHDPRQPGSLGGVARFARSLKLPAQKVRKLLGKDLGWTLHKPRRRHFPTLLVLVFNIDQQWVADLLEVQNMSKYNKDGDRCVFQL